MSENQTDEQTVKSLAIDHYGKILFSTELLLQYADFEGLSITEAIRDIIKKVKKLKAELRAEQK